MSRPALERAVLDHLRFTCQRELERATPSDWYTALSYAVRDRLAERWLVTRDTYKSQDVKRAYYLSAEFLLGRALAHNLINLGLFEAAEGVFAARGMALSDVLEQEHDPGLGNGGLGRLAACFLDSLATLALPGFGYGIRYDYGIFEQHIEDGRQVERGDDWLRHGNPWEQPRYDYSVPVKFFGRVVEGIDRDGRYQAQWIDADEVIGVPYDLPVSGYGNDTVNTLRLWSAKAAKAFNLELFNAGDYRRAVEAKAISESISKVLYPSDHSPEGRELRLKQQYFFVACSLHDLVRRYKDNHGDDFSQFPNKVAIQLNDTHPAVTVAELMRLFVDREGLTWDAAWALVQGSVAYTNHTLLPEALERWPVPMFERLLPRHMQIIYEINRRFLRTVHVRWPGDQARLRRMSIIEEGAVQQVRMAHLATVGSRSVNGVAAMHSDLVKSLLLPDFAQLWPERFNNKTNGVTPRRWLRQANPGLSAAITKRIGDAWIKDLSQLAKLDVLADDAAFKAELRTIKLANKAALAEIIWTRNKIKVDPTAMFDVQVKRIHEYKRQLLSLLHVISLYLRIKDDPNADIPKRVFIFAGKAAPGYAVAKHQIKLINDVAAIINDDPMVGNRLKVVFLANYSVSLAERIIPATDVSEQISTAGKEASGTGNMKFSMNGALTIGTLDGANVEIREAVGAENFFLFGHEAPQVQALLKAGYDPMRFIERSPMLRRVIDLIDSGFFSPDDKYRFKDVTADLRGRDMYLLCADFDAYVAAQETLAKVWAQPDVWDTMVVHNIANTGRFSSDRTIGQYASEIWGVEPVAIKLTED
jgi:starch phosphorylase